MSSEVQATFENLLATRGQSLPTSVSLNNLAAWVKENNSPLTVFDFEATNKIVGWARVTQIGLVHVPTCGEIRLYESLVDPERPIPKKATEISGITQSMVAGKPKWDQGWHRVFHWIANDHVTAGFNSKSFDCKLAQRLNEKFGLGETKFDRHIDVKYLPGVGGSLATASERHGVLFHGQQHHALADALATAEILNCVIASISDDVLFGRKSQKRVGSNSIGNACGPKAERLQQLEHAIRTRTLNREKLAEQHGVKVSTLESDIVDMVACDRIKAIDVMSPERIEEVTRQLAHAFEVVWEGETWGRKKPVMEWLGSRGFELSWMEFNICLFRAGAKPPAE